MSINDSSNLPLTNHHSPEQIPYVEVVGRGYIDEKISFRSSSDEKIQPATNKTKPKIIKGKISVEYDLVVCVDVSINSVSTHMTYLMRCFVFH